MMPYFCPARLDSLQRRACVVDPVLALSQSGITLLMQLRGSLEIWIARELWNILKNPSAYLSAPELILPVVEENQPILENMTQALLEWEKIDSQTDLMRLQLHWLGDSLRESCLPRDRDFKIFEQWELLAQQLDLQLNLPTNQLLSLAFRDTIALALCLGSAFILTYQSRSDASPEICRFLEQTGISCERLSLDDEITMMERDYFRQLLMNLGLTSMFWTELKLGVLYLIAPTSIATSDQLILRSRHPFHQQFRGFWYQI